MKKMKSMIFVLMLAICLCNRAEAHEAGNVTDSADSVQHSNSAVLLNELEVKANRYVRTPNGLTVIPDNNQRRQASSGYDLLRNLMIPGLNVDAMKGSVTALGGAVSLYIDGMPADEREVRQLRPQDVERVLFMEAPTGRYAGDTTALNFILKKRESGGYVAADALQRVGYTAGDYNIAAKYYRSNTQYTLFAGTDYKELRGAESDRTDALLFSDSPVNRHHSTLYSSSRKNSQYGQLRVRNKNDRRTLRATLSVVRDALPIDRNVSELLYSGSPTESPAAIADRSESSRSMKYSLGLSGSFKLPAMQTVDASASATLTHTSYDYTYVENTLSAASFTSEDFYNFNANISYVKTFPQGNSLTAKVTELFNVSSASYGGTFGSWQHLWMSESLAFVEYMQILGSVGSLRVSPGVSAQFYRLHLHELVSNVAPRAQVVLTLQPARGQFAQIGGVFGNSYPQLSMITGATTQVDGYQIRRGNPALGQTKMWNCLAAYGLSVGKINMQAVALLNGAADLPLADYSFADGMLVQSYRGDGRWTQFNPYLSVTLTPSRAINMQFTGGWLYNTYRGGANLTSACLTAEARVNWYVGNFLLSAYASTPRKIAENNLTVTRSIWDFGLSAGWSKGDLHIEAGLHNPLYRHPRVRQAINTPQYISSANFYSPSDRQSAYFKVSYTIDFGKKTSRDTPNIDRSVSSALLRAH